MKPVFGILGDDERVGAPKCCVEAQLDLLTAWSIWLKLKELWETFRFEQKANGAGIVKGLAAMRHILHAQKTVDIATDELAAISRLFSAGVVREMARKGRSPQLSAEFQTIAPTPQRRIRQRFLHLSGKPVSRPPEPRLW